MEYFILLNEYENEELDAMLGASSKYLDRIGVSFNEGELLPMEDILFPIEITIGMSSLRGRMTDILFLDEIDTFIISGKAIEVFEKKGITNIQFLPIILIDTCSNVEEVVEAKLKDEKIECKKVIYENYSLLNITGLLECIHHEASKLEYFVTPAQIPDDMPEEMKAAMQQEEDNDIDFIRKLVLDETKIPEDIHIFRLKDCPRILVFKEHIVQAIREAKLTGFVFVPLSEYTDEIPDDDDDDEKEESEKEAVPVAATIEVQQPAPNKTGGIVIKKRNQS